MTTTTRTAFLKHKDTQNKYFPLGQKKLNETGFLTKENTELAEKVAVQGIIKTLKQPGTVKKIVDVVSSYQRPKHIEKINSKELQKVLRNKNIRNTLVKLEKLVINNLTGKQVKDLSRKDGPISFLYDSIAIVSNPKIAFYETSKFLNIALPKLIIPQTTAIQEETLQRILPQEEYSTLDKFLITQEEATLLIKTQDLTNNNHQDIPKQFHDAIIGIKYAKEKNISPTLLNEMVRKKESAKEIVVVINKKEYEQIMNQTGRINHLFINATNNIAIDATAYLYVTDPVKSILGETKIKSVKTGKISDINILLSLNKFYNKESLRQKLPKVNCTALEIDGEPKEFEKAIPLSDIRNAYFKSTGHKKFGIVGTYFRLDKKNSIIGDYLNKVKKF